MTNRHPINNIPGGKTIFDRVPNGATFYFVTNGKKMPCVKRDVRSYETETTINGVKTIGTFAASSYAPVVIL